MSGPTTTQTPPTLPLTVADQVEQRHYDHNLLHVRWGDVFKYQHWGGLLIFIPAIVITGVSHWTFQNHPKQRQALLYDATISYPYHADQTIPNSQATAYNWILLVVAVLVIELALLRRQHSLTVGITGAIHQVWCCAINFVVVVAVTEITKAFSGRLRPDFLARCQPSILTAGAGGGSPFSDALSANAPTLGPVHVGQVAGDCTNPDAETVRDGRLSFPSGHASNSMAVAWFTVIYVIWSMYLRHDAPYPGRLHAEMRRKQLMRGGMLRHVFVRLVQELWHALVYAFVLLALCLSWFIGITRFWDNVHNISDIIGGFVVAIIFTTPFAIKAIGLHGCIKRLIDGPDNTHPVLAPPGGVAPVTAQHGTAARGAAPHGPAADGQHVALNMAQPPAGVQG